MRWVGFVFTLPVFCLAAPGPQLSVSAAPVLIADQTGAATGVITIENAGEVKDPIRISLTDFEHASPVTGKSYPLNANCVLAGVDDADKDALERKKPFPKLLTLRITVTNLWEAGISTARLQADGRDIPLATIKALRIPQAYNVKIEAENPNKPELIVALGRHPTIRLLNSDPMTHAFRWMFRGKGADRSGEPNTVEIPANGSAEIDLSKAVPERGLTTLIAAGTLKDDVGPAELVLTPMLGDTAAPPQKPVVLPLSLRFRFWTDGLQDAVNLLCVFALLLLGGILSIWVHCGMPNTTRALALRRRLAAVRDRINGLGDNVDSRWRVLLNATERSVAERLESEFWIFPSFAAVLDNATKDAEMLEGWTDCAYAVSLAVQETRQQISRGLPPTVLRWIEEKSNQAIEPIGTGFTSPDELQAMRAAAKSVADLLAAAAHGSPIPDLEKAIAERESRVSDTEKENRLKDCLPKEFATLIQQVAAFAGTPIKPEMYFDRDTLSWKVDLLHQYSDLAARLTPATMATASGGNPAPSPPSAALRRLVQQQDRFFDYLRPEAPESLRQAETFLLEMKQDIYADALQRELEMNPPALEFSCRQSSIEPGEAVPMSLRFQRSILNSAAARAEWTVDWNFGDQSLDERGWDIYHVYAKAGSYPVNIAIRKTDDLAVAFKMPAKDMPVGSTQDGKISLSRAWRYFSPEFKLEFSRLLLVLAAAVIGLLATAQQQAQNLSLLQAAGAVMALGFGADTLKSLLTQKPSA